jgi:hypothetical protein
MKWHPMLLGTKSTFLSTTHSKLVTVEHVHTALRFCEWALEFMIVPPACFALVFAGSVSFGRDRSSDHSKRGSGSHITG